MADATDPSIPPVEMSPEEPRDPQVAEEPTPVTSSDRLGMQFIAVPQEVWDLFMEALQADAAGQQLDEQIRQEIGEGLGQVRYITDPLQQQRMIESLPQESEKQPDKETGAEPT